QFAVRNGFNLVESRLLIAERSSRHRGYSLTQYSSRMSVARRTHTGCDGSSVYFAKARCEERNASWNEVARALFRVRDLHVCLDHRAADLPGHHARFTLAIESGSACCVSIDRLVVDFTNGNRWHGMRTGCDRTGQKHDLGLLAGNPCSRGNFGVRSNEWALATGSRSAYRRADCLSNDGVSI